MVKNKDLEFSTSLGVLYAIKAAKNHSTLKQTYEYLGSGDLDTIYEVLLTAYNKQNKTTLTLEEFTDLLDEKDIGFVSASAIYTELVEGIMYNGLSPEEIEAQKKFMMSQAKTN